MGPLLQNIIGGFVATLAASVIAYTFRIRQLYLVVPRFFAYSDLTSSGKLVEVSLINRGRVTEEEIVVELAPGGGYELVAASKPDVTLHNNVLKIPRAAPGDDISAIFITSDIQFASKAISVSSKTTRGRVFEKLADVPPNFGKVTLGAVAFIAIPIALIFGMDKVTSLLSADEQKPKATITESTSSAGNDGSAADLATKVPAVPNWEGLESWQASEYAKSYPTGALAVQYVSHSRKQDIVVTDFRITNLTSQWLYVSLQSISPQRESDPAPYDNRWLFDLAVGPQDTREVHLKTYVPVSSKYQIAWYEVSIGKDTVLSKVRMKFTLKL
jgi:hypothetical protein